MCVCVVKRGLNNHDDKEMEFCLFVCIGELSRIELFNSVCVSVILFFCCFCNCSSIGERWQRGSHLSDQTRACLIDQIPWQTWRKVLFVIICSSFVFRPPFFFLFLAFWFVSCEPEISPRSLYLFFIVLFFVFSRKNGVRFFVCFAFCLLLLLFQSIFKLLIIIFNFTYFLLLLLFVFN